MPSTWLQIAMFVAAGAFVAAALYLIIFLKRVQATLQQIDLTLSTTRQTLSDFNQQVSLVVSKIGNLEVAARDIISDTKSKLEVIDREMVPLVRELKNTARAYRELEGLLEKKVDQDLSPLVRDTREIASEVKQVAGNIKKRVRQTEGIFEAAEETGKTLKVASGIVRAGLTGLAIQVASIATGMKSSLEFLSENLIVKGVTKGGGEE